MPRNGSGVYSQPVGTKGTPGQPIESAKYNTFIDDLVEDLNANRWGFAVYSGGAVYKTTKVLLEADLAHDANTTGIVYRDATAGNIGIYTKVGASGTGSWTHVLNHIPGHQIVDAVDDGASTANAYTMNAEPYVSGASQLISFEIPVTNTSESVTISFDNGAAYNLKTNSGNNPVIGGLVSGIFVLGKIIGSDFRLISDQASAAIQAAAENAASSAAASATAAAGIVQQLVSVFEYGAVGDGIADDTNAFNDALAANRNVYVPYTAGGYKTTGPINFIENGQRLYGDPSKRPTIHHSGAKFSGDGIDSVTLQDLIFYGPHTSTSYSTSVVGSDYWQIIRVDFDHQNSCLYLENCNGWYWDRPRWHETRGTRVQFNPCSNHIVMNSEGRNSGSFGWWLQAGSNKNRFVNPTRYVNSAFLTDYLRDLESGGVPTSVSGRCGFEEIGIRFGSNHNKILFPEIENCAENGISLTGDRNQVIGGRVFNPEILGVGVYGVYNEVIGVSVFGVGPGTTAASFQAAANAGGLGRNNRFIGCEASSGKSGFVLKNDAYQEWVSGGGTAPSYTKSISGSNIRIYRRIGASAGVYGTIKPVHDSGVVSDGLNNWEFTNKITVGDLQSQGNMVIGCVSTGMSVAEFTDSTTDKNNVFAQCSGTNSTFFNSAPGLIDQTNNLLDINHADQLSVNIVSGAIDVTGHSNVRIGNGSANLTDILSNVPTSLCPRVFITSLTGTITVIHNTSKIRCRGGVNQTIVANQGGLEFIRVKTSNAWQQIG